MGQANHFDAFCFLNNKLVNIIVFSYTAFHSDMKSTGNNWVLVNLNITGYYRVNYDTENWERLLNQLTGNHEVKTQRHVSEITGPVIMNKFNHIYFYFF